MPKHRAPLARTALTVTSVLLLHGVALWALQGGLRLRTTEVLVPVQALSAFIEPPQPVRALAPITPITPITPAVPKAVAAPPPMPQAAPAPTAAHAPTMPPAPVAQASPAKTAPVLPAAASAPVPAPAPVVALPSSEADYLNNPKPAYPAMSRRLGEQGRVVVRVLIGVGGAAEQGEIRQSSGSDRLDQAALTTALRWRYVPGQRGGVAQAMWFNVPINFVLE